MHGEGLRVAGPSDGGGEGGGGGGSGDADGGGGEGGGSGIRIFTGETDRCFLFGTRGFNFRTAPLLSRCEIAWNS